ncbi:MAG TPA: hypothetical protein VF411_15520 [Bacteroidia bacterium]
MTRAFLGEYHITVTKQKKDNMKIAKDLTPNQLCLLQQEVLFLHLHHIKTNVIRQVMKTNKRDVETINTRLMDIFCPHLRSIKAVKEKARRCAGLTELLQKNMGNKHAQLIARYGLGNEPISFSKKNVGNQVHILIHRK